MARAQNQVSEQKPQPASESVLIEALKTLGLTAILAFGIRTFVVEARYIPTGSSKKHSQPSPGNTRATTLAV